MRNEIDLRETKIFISVLPNRQNTELYFTWQGSDDKIILRLNNNQVREMLNGMKFANLFDLMDD